MVQVTRSFPNGGSWHLAFRGSFDDARLFVEDSTGLFDYTWRFIDYNTAILLSGQDVWIVRDMDGGCSG